jgi:hypothetical protein
VRCELIAAGGVYRCEIGECINIASGTSEFGVGFLFMNERVIVDAIKVAQNLLWRNLPPTQNLPDATTLARVCDLVRSPSVQSALGRSSDTFLAFVLRAVEHVVADQSRTDRETISRLWDVLDDPHLNRALGLPQNSRMTFGPNPKRR